MEVEVIHHTAETQKNMMGLLPILNSKAETIELDFVFTRDGIPVWTHNVFPTQLQKYESIESKELKLSKKALTLYRVLDIINKNHKVMLDIKYVPRDLLKSDSFKKLLEYLNNYDKSGGIQIQTLDLGLLQKLSDSGFSNIEPGLIINVLSKNYINKSSIPRIDFMSISSELWERNSGKYIKDCNDKELFKDVKLYAWTWDVSKRFQSIIPSRPETEERIQNFIDMGADGIITGNPNMVLKLLNSQNKKN